MDLQSTQKYFIERIGELRFMCKDETPWIFLCSSAMIEYLSKIVRGKNRGRTGYIRFIKEYMALHRPSYRDFVYKNGKQDLPDQMYHILRCGLIHNLSFIPDVDSIHQGGRTRSIVLCHQNEATAEGWHHLMPYSSPEANDGVLFIAETFIEDISETINLIFKMAEQDRQLRGRIEIWTGKYPPIAAVT